MRFGYCLNLGFLEGDEVSRKILDAVCASGFDFLELPMFALTALSPDKLAQLKKALSDKGVPCLACNIFFPQSVPIVGPDKDVGEIKAYIDKAMAIAKDLGVETIVFGNGGARRDATWDELQTVVKMLDEAAGKNNLSFVIEPLNKKETNTILSYTEAVKLAEGAKNVRSMCDWYHTCMEAQTLDDLYEYPDMLGHLHIAYSKERLIPSPNDDMSFYDDFVKTIKQLGYNNKLSVEGSLRNNNDPAQEIKQCLETLKQLFN